MIELNPIELVLGLLVVAIALAYAARRIGIAYPILLVIGGLALGFLPGLPTVELEPEVRRIERDLDLEALRSGA